MKSATDAFEDAEIAREEGASTDHEALMEILNDAGAYCGECGYEDGYKGKDGCSQCAETLTGYANAILAAGFSRQSPASTTAADAWDAPKSLEKTIWDATKAFSDGRNDD